MDEMRLEEWFSPFYRWGLKGVTPEVCFHQNRNNSQSFFGGLSLLTKTVTTHLVEKQNSVEFLNFLDRIKAGHKEEIAARLPWQVEYLKEVNQGKKTEEQVYEGLILVFLDGAGFHRSTMVKEYLKANYGIFEFFRFPTYSPDLNPQEHVWKALRKHLSSTTGLYSFKETVDRACRFLATNTFDYHFLENP